MHGIPVLTARGRGIAEAWENSMIVLNERGCDIRTQYDKPEDPPSKDATMLLIVEEPLAEPMIHKDMTFLVRQLQPTEHGLPIQIYVFTTDTAWVNYESIQADIFDHILAVAPKFDLRVFQQPSGSDIRALGDRTTGVDE